MWLPAIAFKQTHVVLISDRYLFPCEGMTTDDEPMMEVVDKVPDIDKDSEIHN